MRNVKRRRPMAIEVRKDGIADGCTPGTTDDFDADICFADGQLVRYPEGIQRQGED